MTNKYISSNMFVRICSSSSNMPLFFVFNFMEGLPEKRNQFAVVTDGHRRTQVGARGARWGRGLDCLFGGFAGINRR